jgi:hypothetical protein
LSNILKYPTVSRYFTINKSKRVFRHAFDGFESEIDAFLVFLGSAPCFCTENLPFIYALTCTNLGFIPSQVPSKAANLAGTGDGLDNCLVLPIDFCWELVSEACRTLNDYRKLPNIERWNSLEAIVLQKSDGTLLP